MTRVSEAVIANRNCLQSAANLTMERRSIFCRRSPKRVGESRWNSLKTSQQKRRIYRIYVRQFSILCDARGIREMPDAA